MKLNIKNNSAQKRCEDCSCLKITKGEWLCDECFGQKIEDIDDCPLGVELVDIQAIEQKAKNNKILHNAKSATPKERKPRERKPNPEKEWIIQLLAETLKIAQNEDLKVEQVNITNISKIIEFNIGGNHYKVDLIKQKSSKKS